MQPMNGTFKRNFFPITNKLNSARGVQDEGELFPGQDGISEGPLIKQFPPVVGSTNYVNWWNAQYFFPIAFSATTNRAVEYRIFSVKASSQAYPSFINFAEFSSMESSIQCIVGFRYRLSLAPAIGLDMRKKSFRKHSTPRGFFFSLL